MASGSLEYLRSHLSVLYSAALRYFTADYDHLYADYAEEAGYSTRTEHGLHERHAVCNAAVLCLVCLSGICRCWFLLGLFVLLLAVADHRFDLYFTPERGAKIIEKENKKMEARYAAGKAVLYGTNDESECW